MGVLRVYLEVQDPDTNTVKTFEIENASLSVVTNEAGEHFDIDGYIRTQTHQRSYPPET